MSNRVRFDIDGSLQAARELWTFADQLQNLQRRRDSLSQIALTGWEGPTASTFRIRMSDESCDLQFMAEQAHQDAQAWTITKSTKSP